MFKKKHIIFLIIILSIIIISPINVFAEDTNTNNNTTTQNTNVVQSENNNYTIFLVSDNPGTNILDMASQDIIESKNYTNLALIVRSGDQIKEMGEEQLHSLLSDSDAFICEWVSSDVDAVLTNILNKYPDLSNKQIFLILEPPTTSTSTSLNLLRYNTLNYTKIFKDTNRYSDSLLVSYFSNTQRGLNYNNVYEYITKGEGQQFNTEFNKAVLYKDLNDKDNLLNQILWALNSLQGNINYVEPTNTGTLQYGIYRERYFEDIEEYKALYFKQNNTRTIGIIESTMYVSNQQLDTYYKIIESFENMGYNVIPVVAAGGSSEQLEVMIKYFTNAENSSEFFKNPSKFKSNVNGIISMPAYGIGGVNFNNATDFFEYLNVPIFRAVHSDYVSNEEWELSTTGLPGNRSDKWWHVAIAESQGIIDATFIGGVSNRISNYTGARLTGYVPYMKNIEYMVKRMNEWIDLQYTANENKNISLIYYNYPPGKQNIGSSYLDTITSIYNLLYTLKNEGFTVENLPTNVSQLEDLMIKCGINVATWAPGELEKLANQSNIVLLPVTEYLNWFNNLENITKVQIIEGPVAYIGELARRSVEINYTSPMDERLTEWYNQIVSLLSDENKTKAIEILDNIKQALTNYIKTYDETYYLNYLEFKNQWSILDIPGLNGWGEAPGDIMTINRDGINYFVIPGLKFGNIFIAPEPQRGWEADSNALYHSTAVAPTHQYLAAYYYFQTYYGDAMNFIGRHGTHEFLPGKEILLSTTDFGTICTGYSPQLYFYTSDGLGEAIQAKRRGFAVMIDHLTSPLSHTQLYANYTILGELIAQYSEFNNEAIINQIKTIIVENNMLGGLELNLTDLNTISNKQLIDLVDEYLYNIQMTLYPLGLHSLGSNWSDEKIAKSVSATLSYNFTYGSITTNLYDELAKVLYNTSSFKQLNPILRGELINKSIDIIAALLYWDVETVLNIVDANNTQLEACFREAKLYIDAIRFSVQNEIDMWINGLNGYYIPVGTGGDIIDYSIYPTGTNFYQDQSQELPTPEAFEYGKILTLLTLSELTDDTEKIVMGIWCVETARDDGALVSVVLHLLGMETVYTSSPSAGTHVHDHDDEDEEEGGLKTSNMPRYVSLDNLVRPEGWANKRIDVTVITSGLFRDLYSTQSILMDNAFRVALARSYYTILNNNTLMSSEFGEDMKTALNEIMNGINYYGIGRESFDENYVAKHWVEDFVYFRSLGYDVSTSGEYAITRIFAPPNGDYGAGISKAVQLSWTWNDTNDLAEFYLGRMGNMYSKNYWGESNPIVFANALNRTNKLIVSRNTNQYGVLDNDDFFDYWGGLSLAIKNVTGSEPEMAVLEYANAKEPYIASLEKVLNNELATRYLNPSWIKGMMGEGYSGARYISNKFSSNLLGWSVTRDSTVNNWMWDSVYNTYVNDGYNIGVTSWLQSGNNAYSFISTTGTLLTAAYEGYWKTDASTLSNVANKWAQTVIQNGVACCDCSCGNIAMLQWAINYINPDMLQQFKQQMFQATHNNVFAPESNSNPSDVINHGSVVSNSSNSKEAQSTSPGSSVGEYPSSVSSEGADAGSGDVYEVNTNPSNSNSMTGMSIPALLAVMAIVAIIALGFYRRKDNKEDDY